MADVVTDIWTPDTVDDYVLPLAAIPVAMNTFMNNISHYKVVGGTTIELISGHSLDDRIISSPDNSIPLTLKRANTVTNLGVL